ncbi:MAG: betaine-aldehyde dehydrogenase, partial [Opitutaceae bacterium]
MTSLAEKKLPRVSARSGRPAPELIFGDLWEFDPSPETADPKLKTRYDLFIDGKFVAPKLGKYFDSINPANEQKLAEIAQASAA